MPFLQALDTSALVWRNGLVTTVQLDGFDALLRGFVTYAAGKASLGNVGYTGTGNGLINFLDGGVGAPTETWTITFSDATNFAVSGSVSGAQAAGTTGTLYTTTGDPLTSLFTFQIDVGGTAFVNLDAFTVDATISTLPAADTWILDRWNPEDLADITKAMIWHGKGDGTESIPTGIRLFTNAPGQVWNWRLRNYTGFSAGADWANQPGTSDEFFTAFWDNDMLYWISTNSRRYIVSAKVSTTYHSLYQGLILPFASPNEYPFPSVVIGEKDDNEAWNSTASDFNGIFVPSTNGALRDTAGIWRNLIDSTGVANVSIFPRGTSFASMGNVWDNHENFGSGLDHQLMPLLLATTASSGAPLDVEPFGVLDGANIVTGTNQSTETILSIGGTDWVVFQNIFRNTRDDFWAMEMA